MTVLAAPREGSTLPRAVIRPTARRSPPARTPLRLAARAFLAALSLAALALALAWVDPHAIVALPALMLPALIALRRYPGERLVCALAAAPPRLRARTPARSAPRGRNVSAMPRGGLLLAFSLAVRPPPAAARAAS